jgi:AcrR family transcriptional regulator
VAHTTIEGGQVPPNSRPRDRAQTLLTVAERLFAERGYRAVSVNDIAQAAGITGPALYRHFPSKQALFAEVLMAGLDALQETTDAALAAEFTDPRQRLHAVTVAIATLSVERRNAATLWRWRGDELASDDRDQVIKRGAELITSWAHVLHPHRPELSRSDAKLLCLAALNVCGSVAVHRTRIPKGRYVTTLSAVAERALMTELPRSEPATKPLPAVRVPSKREHILSEATRLFAERGYKAVSMEDIGAAVGLAAPSVYRHYGGKEEILVTAAHRMADQLMLTSTRVLTAEPDPRHALAGLLESYVDTLATYADLLAVYTGELDHVPASRRAEFVKVQRDYVAQWMSLLCDLGHEDAQARVMTHAALSVVNDLSRWQWVRSRGARRAELIALGRAILAL